MKRFFDRLDTHWPREHGALHLYALPEAGDPIIEHMRKEGEALQSRGKWDGVALQPPEYLHMTLQRLDLYRNQLSQEQWSALCVKMSDVAKRHSPFSVDFRVPEVRGEAAEALGSESSEWQKLVDDIRAGLADAGLGSSLTDPPFGPHYTFAYCSKDTDSDADKRLQHTIDEVCVPQSMQVKTLYLVAVNQYPEEGVFRFTKLHGWPLGL